MDKFKNYNIAFTGLNLGKHQFKFEVDQEFLNLFGIEQEFFNPKIDVDVLLDKHSTFLEFWIDLKGSVQLICDISNDEFSYPLEYSVKILVKYGDSYDDRNEEVITIPHSDSDFNIAQLIFEGLVLSIPMKKVSPEVEDDDHYQDLLDKYSPKFDEDLPEDEEENEDIDADPRWAALKKLKDNK